MQTFLERLSTLMHHFHSDLLNEYSPKEQEKQTCRRGQTIIMNAYWWLYYLEVIAIWRWTHIPCPIIPNLSIHHHPFHHPSPWHGDVHRVGCCEGGLHRLRLDWSASIEIVKQKHCKTTFQKYFILYRSHVTGENWGVSTRLKQPHDFDERPPTAPSPYGVDWQMNVN